MENNGDIEGALEIYEQILDGAFNEEFLPDYLKSMIPDVIGNVMRDKTRKTERDRKRTQLTHKPVVYYE